MSGTFSESDEYKYQKLVSDSYQNYFTKCVKSFSSIPDETSWGCPQDEITFRVEESRDLRRDYVTWYICVPGGR